MAKAFNFNKLQRKYMNVTLKNGKTYLVAMPSKGTFERLYSLKEIDTEKPETIDELYACIASIISNNKQGYRVNADDLENYDIEEIMAFIREYMEFVQSLSMEKNS